MKAAVFPTDVLVGDAQAEIFRSAPQNFSTPPDSLCSLRVRFAEVVKDGKMQESTCEDFQWGTSRVNA